MKRHVQEPGVRKWSGNDLLELQGEGLSIADGFFSQFGDCVVCGCQVSGGSVTSGLVCLGGMVMPLEAFTPEVFPVYLVAAKEHLQREYADDVVRDIAVRHYARPVSVRPEEGGCIELTENGADSFFDHSDPKWLGELEKSLVQLGNADKELSESIATLAKDLSNSDKRIGALEGKTIDAYEAAVSGGYQGTREEFYTLLATIETKAGDMEELLASLDGKFAEVPTISGKPTESTLSYQSGGETRPFSIGQFCRVPDRESEEGYTFYILYDIKDGKAVWGRQGSGESADLREVLRISVQSNQPQPDSSVLGATVTVTDTTLGKEVLNAAWEGEELVCRITALSEYTVSVSPLEGYATPATQQYKASIQGERNAVLTYNACLLTVNLLSNQADQSDVAGAKSTVSYEGASRSVELANGGSVKVPMGSEVSISASPVSRYATPPLQKFTPQEANRATTMTYTSCLLTVHIAGLKGTDTASATVSYTGGEKRVLPDGGSCLVPYGVSVTVTVPAVSGYDTPKAVTFTPAQASKEITLEYIPSALQLSILSNQPDKSDLSGLKATVSYSGGSFELTDGETRPIPMNSPVTVKFPALPGYRKPADITFTNAGGLASKSGTYEAELVTITLDSDDSTSMSGQQVTVNGTPLNYPGSPVSHKVPFGTAYSVSVNMRTGYTTPSGKNFTAGQASRSVTMTYSKIRDASIVFDTSISDPCNITGEVNSGVIATILSKFRRCLCKKTADGEVTISYLKDSDSNYYSDNSTSKLDGTEGDVMVDFPEFYYKWEKVDANRFRYRFAEYNVDGTFKHVPRSLVGAYKGYNSSGKLYSRSGVDPTENVSYTNFVEYAKARGAGYQIIDFQQHCVIAFMLYARYGNRNLQAVLGVGGATYSPITKTGTSNLLGNRDTANESTGYVNGLGIEGVFGGIYEWVQNVTIQDRVWTITDPDGGKRSVNAGTSDGWITKVAAEAGPCFDMVPTAVGGSETTHYSDYYWQLSGGPFCLLRSYCSSGTDGGVAYSDAYYDASYTYTYIGSRLAFRGVIREASSVSAFKSLPVL